MFNILIIVALSAVLAGKVHLFTTYANLKLVLFL